MNKTIIFDLDGTLLNTLADLTNSVNFALKKLNIPFVYSEQEVKMMVGNGVSVLMQRALDRQYQSFHAEALRLQREYYAAHSADFSQPYEGICAMLLNLKQLGFTVAVHTNKDEIIAKPLCNAKLPGLCDFVCGTVEGGKPKPDAARILRLLNSLGNPDAVYCGDSDVDILTAKNAGIPCISVTWGFRDRQFLIAHNATYLVDTPADVVLLAKRLTAMHRD